jgi:tRNA(Ile)-lysidine synthase
MADESIGIRSNIRTLHWPLGRNPTQLRNFETAARIQRYRELACACLAEDIKALFLGHHLTDQVETIIHRLIRGQRMASRGLSGMRHVSTIPCCDNIYGAADGSEASPLSSLLEDTSTPLRTTPELAGLDMPTLANGDKYSPAPILISHGGISLYRPLLAFPKSRLIATCQVNDVQYVTDPSNFDPTTTTRNAIRWLLKNDKLPMALRQDSVLRLTAASTSIEMARSRKVRGLLNATQVVDLNIRSGRLVVLLPPGDILDVHNASGTDVAPYIDRLVRLVSPNREYNEPFMQLVNIAMWMFPELRDHSQSPFDKLSDLPSRTARGVLIARLPHPSGRLWEMTRRPFTAQEDHREAFVPAPFYAEERNRDWSKWTLWDGRYWIRIRTRDPEDVRQFKVRALRHTDMEELNTGKIRYPWKQKAGLKKVLRDTAPGKLRYTLPVLVKGGELRSLPTFNFKFSRKNLPQRIIGTEKLGDDLRWEVRYKDISETLQHLNKAPGDTEDSAKPEMNLISSID